MWSVWPATHWTAAAAGSNSMHGHRGRKTDPLYRSRRTLHTGADLLTDKQQTRLEALFIADDNVEVEATWGIYQRMIAAYREPDRTLGRFLMQQLIDNLSSDVPDALVEVTSLGRILKKRADDVLAYSTGPAPATDPPKRSTAAWNTSAAWPSGSATSPTTSPEHSWRPEDSDPDYTVDCQEPR